jgi:hypothetical protein
MSWLYSQVLVAEYLGENYLDGEQSVPLSGNSTQLAYLPQDKMTDFSRLSRFGMMFKPLTESLGKELLMLYLGDFHAKTSQLLEKEQELKVNALECGNTWRELLGKYNPNTALWKTAQCSLIEDLEQSLEIWPRWGSMRSGECYRQPMLVQNIKESEFGSWGTPTASDWKGTHHASNYVARKKQYQDLTNGMAVGTIYPNPITYEALMGWPIGWTDLKPLEMDKSHSVQQPLGTSLKED